MGKNMFLLESQPEKDFALDLVTAQSCIPQWYKDGKPHTGEKLSFESKLSFKLCVPFLEGLSSGYMLLLPCDVYVRNLLGQIMLYSEYHVTEARERVVSQTLPTPSGHLNSHFTWLTYVSLKAPKGCSLFITHPLNRFDLPFTSTSGIVDGGWSMYGGSLPFFLKEGFEGVIPKGTPIAQIIPFKQESWKNVKSLTLATESQTEKDQRTHILSGWYKHKYWRKKTYN